MQRTEPWLNIYVYRIVIHDTHTQYIPDKYTTLQMDCIPIGTQIATIAIQTHGSIIELDLSPEHNVFQNARLFSYAGDYSSVYSTRAKDYDRILQLRSVFSRDIRGDDMVSQLDAYIVPTKKEYKGFLKKHGVYTEEARNAVCKKMGAITVDKSFGVDNDSILQRCMKWIFPQAVGIYVISLHEKTGDREYIRLPSDTYERTPTNLMDMNTYRNSPDIIDFIKNAASPFPNAAAHERRTRESDIGSEGKDALENAFYREIQDWKCTLNEDGSQITYIRLSFLTQIVHMLYGTNCRIHYMDYSCNEVSKYVPTSQHAYKKYFGETDIEQGVWGSGPKPESHKKKTRQHKRRKTRKHRKTRKSTSPHP